MAKTFSSLQTRIIPTVTWLATLSVCLLCAVTASANELKSKGEYVIEPGESFYAIVANNYPDRMNRWTDVASDLVALNPELFPRGMDTPLQPGMVIKLVDYDSTSSEASQPESNPRSTSARPTNANNGDTNTSVTRPASSTVRPSSDSRTNSGQNETADTSNPTQKDSRSATESGSDGDATIGTVTSLSGNAQATDYADKVRGLEAGSVIYPHEIIYTGRNTEITLQMIDEAVYTIHDNSRFAFETYDFANRIDSDRSVVTLSGGSFRVISGKIGAGNKNAMSVNTPAATITVRDSDFALRICEDDACRFSVAGHELKDGLYAGLLTGSAILTNNAGPQRINAGEIFYTPSPDSSALKAPESAPLLFSVEELSSLEVSDEDDPKSFLGWLMSKLFGD